MQAQIWLQNPPIACGCFRLRAGALTCARPGVRPSYGFVWNSPSLGAVEQLVAACDWVIRPVGSTHTYAYGALVYLGFVHRYRANVRKESPT